MTKKHEKLPSMQGVNLYHSDQIQQTRDRL